MLAAILGINGLNGSVIAFLTIGEVKDLVAIILGVVSIFSTALIIATNLKSLRKGKKPDRHSGGGLCLAMLAICLPFLGGCASTVDPETGKVHRSFDPAAALEWVRTAGEVNSMANPTPTAPIINLALTGISLFLAAYARKQRAKARLVDSLIQGVEKSGSQEAKDSIRDVAMRSGLGDRLHEHVKKLT